MLHLINKDQTDVEKMINKSIASPLTPKISIDLNIEADEFMPKTPKLK